MTATMNTIDRTFNTFPLRAYIPNNLTLSCWITILDFDSGFRLLLFCESVPNEIKFAPLRVTKKFYFSMVLYVNITLDLCKYQLRIPNNQTVIEIGGFSSPSGDAMYLRPP